MTSPTQILDMHNWERPSHLTERNQFWLWLVRETSTPEDEKHLLVDTLLERADQAVNPLEKAELYINCAMFFLEKSRCDDAIRWLGNARDIYGYQRDMHHEGITEWLLHKVYHQQGDYRTAYTWAINARKIFDNFCQIRGKQGDKYQENWYRQRVYDITCDLVQSPHYVFEWLNRFHPNRSRLSTSARKIQEEAVQLMTSRSFPEMVKKVPLLLSLARQSEDKGEFAEACVFSGLCLVAAGNWRDAATAFQSGLANYLPRTHEYVHTRWMLSLALFENPDRMTESVINMETCLTEMEELCAAADHQNRIEDCQWYTVQREGMRRALQLMLARRV